MTDRQCANPRCWPRPAADGRELCWTCRDRIGRDALTSAAVYADLGYRLAPTPGGRERVADAGRDRTLTLNLAAVDARTLIRHTLAAISRLISDDRGRPLPTDAVPDMARYVASSADWLAARPADLAGSIADELAELARGRPWALAYPVRSARVPLARACPEDVLDASGDFNPCPGALYAILRPSDALRPPEVACDHDEAHTWPTWRWAALADRLEPAA